MNDEAAFLAQIAATPEDIAPRFVYADWLQERDDPRGELIRIVEEMRTLPVYSDEFWALKPRRNELRSGVAEEWLNAMHYDDVWPVLTHGIPDDWKGRWRLVREYTERWYRKSFPDVGELSPNITRLEQILQRPLPPSVREWVSLVDQLRRDQYGDRDYIAHRYQIEVLNDLGVLSLLWEMAAGGRWQRAVRYADWNQDDPPVYSVLQGFEQQRRVNPTADFPSLSSFVVDETIGFSLATRHSLRVEVDHAHQLVAECASYFPSHACHNDVHYYEDTNLCARIGPLKGGEAVLFIEVAKHGSRQTVPAFLWAACAQGRYVQGEGLFSPLQQAVAERQRP